MKQTVITFKQRAGVTDLCNYHPGLAAEWWTQEQWDEWNAKAPEREARDKAYIEQLVAEGRLGEVYEVKVTMAHNPVFDEPSPKLPSLSSFQFMILNTSTDETDPV